MSEESSTSTPSTGSSESFKTGIQAENANAGFRPMPEPNRPAPRKEKEYSGAREAGADLARRRTVDAWPEKPVEAEPIYYTDGKGGRAPANEAIDLRRGQEDLAALRQRQADKAELDGAVAFEDDVNLNRAAEGFIANPEAYAQEPKQPQLEQPQHEPATTNGLDAETAAALAKPKIREAIQAEVTKAQETQAQYSQALTNAYKSSLAIAGAAFPELQNKNNAEILQTLQQMQVNNPKRFERAYNAIQGAAQVETAMINDQKRQHAVHNKWIGEQDQVFERAFANRTPQQRAAIGAEVVNYAAELGVSKAALTEALVKNPVLRSAAVQRMMAELAEFRLAKKEAAKYRSKVATNIPTVAKPGNGGNRGVERGQADLAALSKRIGEAKTTEGSLRAAAALLSTKRNNRTR